MCPGKGLHGEREQEIKVVTSRHVFTEHTHGSAPSAVHLVEQSEENRPTVICAREFSLLVGFKCSKRYPAGHTPSTNTSMFSQSAVSSPTATQLNDERSDRSV